jgi:hypothetical protein
MFFLSPFEVMVVGMNGANDRQDVRSSGIRKENESIAMFGVGLGMSLSFRYAGVRHLPLDSVNCIYHGEGCACKRRAMEGKGAACERVLPGRAYGGQGCACR